VSPARRGQLPRSQVRTRRDQILSSLLRRFCQLQLPRQIIRVELRHALPAKQRIFGTPHSGKQLRRLIVLFDRFIAAVLPEAFRRARLQITGLDLAGRPLARQIMFTAGEGGVVFKIAYDETHEKCSPGVLGEAEMVRHFLDNPGPAWMDSNTAPENAAYGGIWKDRRTMQSVAVGLQGAGKLVVALLPLLRLAKRWRWSPGRIIPAMGRTGTAPAGLAAAQTPKPRGL